MSVFCKQGHLKDVVHLQKCCWRRKFLHLFIPKAALPTSVPTACCHSLKLLTAVYLFWALHSSCKSHSSTLNAVLFLCCNKATGQFWQLVYSNQNKDQKRIGLYDVRPSGKALIWPDPDPVTLLGTFLVTISVCMKTWQAITLDRAEYITQAIRRCSSDTWPFLNNKQSSVAPQQTQSENERRCKAKCICRAPKLMFKHTCTWLIWLDSTLRLFLRAKKCFLISSVL